MRNQEDHHERPISPIRLLACAPDMTPDSDLVGTTKAAELLGVSRNRVRQLVASGQLPAERIGRTFVIRLRDIEAFAAAPPGRPRYPRRVR
jgi:excisionase family DNA binding protein